MNEWMNEQMNENLLHILKNGLLVNTKYNINTIQMHWIKKCNTIFVSKSR